MKEIMIYTDGACRGNPGRGGYGVILEYEDSHGKLHAKELSEGYKNTTNNRMEILAAVAGLETLKKPCQVKLYSDSQYVVKAINEGWLKKWKANDWFRDKKKKEKAKNVDLWKRLDGQLKIHNVEFIWVKGHAGHPKNERCDQLATAAADQDVLQEDFQE